MKNKDKAIYIKIRSECIKANEDYLNGDKYINGFSIEKAEKNAQSDLEIDLARGELRITISELLSFSVEECILLSKSRMKLRRQEMVDNFLKNVA